MEIRMPLSGCLDHAGLGTTFYVLSIPTSRQYRDAVFRTLRNGWHRKSQRPQSCLLTSNADQLQAGFKKRNLDEAQPQCEHGVNCSLLFHLI